METIVKILHTLSVPENAGRVYVELLSRGETTPRVLAQRLGMSRPSVYDQIEILERFGLIELRTLENKTYVAPSPPEQVLKLLENRKKEIASEESAFKEIIKTIHSSTRTDAPCIKFFEGTDAVALALHDILWSGKSDILALWPYEEMLEFFGKPFLVSFNEKRVRQKIKLRTIWPIQSKSANHIWHGNDTNVERRYIREPKRIGMGYTIYEDSVIFISSKKECFGFIITSHDFATMMRFQFETLWDNASKK